MGSPVLESPAALRSDPVRCHPDGTASTGSDLAKRASDSADFAWQLTDPRALRANPRPTCFAGRCPGIVVRSSSSESSKCTPNRPIRLRTS